MATRLYPPYIEGVIPAFSGTEISVPFSMNRAVSKNEVDGFGLKIKTISSNIQIAQVFKQIDKTEEFPNVIKFNISKELANNQFQIGTFYKVQLCYFSYEKDSNGKIIYDNNQTPNRILGYFSTVGVIKYTSNPEVSIIDLSSKNINMHKYDYAGEYKMTEDKSEKVYSYSFDLFDKNKRLVKTSGEMIHNNFNDAEYGISIDTFKIEEDLPMNEICFLQYTVKTINGLIKSSPLYRIAQKNQLILKLKRS